MRPRIHNKKMVAEIREVVIKHSKNEWLADNVVGYISAPSVVDGNDNQPAPLLSQTPPSVSAVPDVKEEELNAILDCAVHQIKCEHEHVTHIRGECCRAIIEHAIKRVLEKKAAVAESVDAPEADLEEKEAVTRNTHVLQKALSRLETVTRRLRYAQRGKEWTCRNADADILDREVIPAVKRILSEHAPKSDSGRGASKPKRCPHRTNITISGVSQEELCPICSPAPSSSSASAHETKL